MRSVFYIIVKNFKIFTIILLFFLNNVLLGNNIIDSLENNYEKFKRSINMSSKFVELDEISSRKKRYFSANRQNKWKFPIPYIVDKTLDFFYIQTALSFITMETCITFTARELEIKRRPGIIFVSGHSYKNFIEKKNDKKSQIIKVSLDKYDIGNLQRKILYTLGLEFEHCHPDRDHYLKIVYQNIITWKTNLFNIIPEIKNNAYKVPYDYGSIMHVGKFFSSANNLETIVPKKIPYSNTLGQNEDLSYLDLKKLNLYYCSKICKKKFPCFNGGYQNPKKCNTCICVRGFFGRHCEYIPQIDRVCGKVKFYASNIPNKIKSNGIKNCFYHILSKIGKKIQITIELVSIPSFTNEFCRAQNSLEIKYLFDKTTTGARFCGYVKSLTFISKSDYVIVYYKSKSRESLFRLSYQEI
ncbi:Astacin-like metalloendopeptidase [Strongyloides ratti]|uniref:Metalloendopeptidase n=1 Tax=Strongyloides ratti TaxID=34506 RepID=A0A090LLL6_STRRB|nr:Astacin-like metalloendopeptidase [Strongyloides ratti]CEF70615.1 Astacin-like metalloendopeptidase [Strongyloides ratti]